MMRRVILGLLLVASLLAPEAQSYAQTDKLSLEALTAPPVGGSGGGYAPARRRAARAYHYRYRTPRAYRHRAYRYGMPRAYRHRAYQHRVSPTYGRHAPRRYGYAMRRPHGAPSGYGRFQPRSMPGLHAHHAVRRLPAFHPSHAGRAHRHRR